MNEFIASLFRDIKKRIILILLLALFIRLLGVVSRPIWYDESFSILFAEKGPSAMLQGTIGVKGTESAEEHPLGYYVILWSWMKIFGTSLISVRFLSILAGLGIVYLVYKISLELFDPKTSETAMLIAAFMPFQVHYAQEIRMYVFLTFWLLLATYSFLRGEKSSSRYWWIVFSLSCALAQYTHNLAAFFLITLAVIPIIKRDWKTFRFVILSGTAAILLYTPWLLQLPSQLAKVGQGYWVNKPGLSSIFNFLLIYTTNTPIPSSWVMPALTIATLFFIIGMLQTARAEKGWKITNGLWAAYFSFALPVFLFVFSQWIPVYIERALLPSSAFFCIWLAWVIHNTKLPNIGQGIFSTLLVAAFGMGIYQHVTYRDFPYGPFKEITNYLHQNTQTGDVIIHSNKLSILPSAYFGNTLPQVFINDPPGSTTDTLAPPTQQVLHVTAKADIETASAGENRIWYIIYQRSLDEYAQAGKITHPDIEYLNTNFTLESQTTWDSLEIFLYSEKP